MQAVFLVWFSFVFPKVSEKTMGEGGRGEGGGGVSADLPDALCFLFYVN